MAGADLHMAKKSGGTWSRVCLPNKIVLNLAKPKMNGTGLRRSFKMLPIVMEMPFVAGLENLAH